MKKEIANTKLIVVLTLVVVLALIIIYVVSDRGKNRPLNGILPENNGPTVTADPVREGDTIKLPAVEERKSGPAIPERLPPQAINDPIRFRDLFREGSTYETTVISQIEGRGNKREWGIQGAADFVLASKQVFSLEIERNDGQNIEARLSIKESAYTELHTKNPEVRVDLGQRAHTILDALGMAITAADMGTIPIPPGISRLTERQLNEMIKQYDLDEILAPFGITPAPPTIDAISGLVVRIHYTDGEGITKMDILELPRRNYGDVDPFIAREELIPLFNHNPVLDLYFFPRASEEVGGRWSVSSSLLPNPFPAHWRAVMLGSMEFERLPDEGGIGRIRALPSNFEARAHPDRRSTINGMIRLREGKVAFQRQGQRQAPMIHEMDFKGAFDFESLERGWILDRSATGRVPTFSIEYRMRIID